MKVKLRTVSPLHIGGQEGVIYPSQYVIIAGRCYVVNEDRLFQRLYDLRRLDDFLEDAQRLSRGYELKTFLSRRNLLRKDLLEDVSSYSSRCRLEVRRELRPFIRNGFSQPFIPGSSIKGVLRTSVMYLILKRLDASLRKRILDDFVQRKLEEYRKDPRGQRGYRWFQERFKQRFAQRLDQDIFQRFILRSDQHRYDAHTDILRFLKVTDSSPIGKNSLVVEEVKIYSAHSYESPKKWSIYAECVPPGTDFEFELKTDEGILADFKRFNRSTAFGITFSDLSDLLSNPLAAAQEMALDLLEREKEFLGEELNMPRPMDFKEVIPNFRMGWGSGLLGTSIVMLLPERLRQDLRNTLFRDRGATPAPKSRRVVVGDGALGWCKLMKRP